MVRENGTAPATKSDIDGVNGRLDGLIVRVDTTEKRLDQKIDRVAVELVRTQADIRDIRETMATKIDVDRILGAIDTFAMKTEYGERARALHGQTLVDVEVTLKDHEKRLSSLEAPRPPSQP